jgi:hypothetical protein
MTTMEELAANLGGMLVRVALTRIAETFEECAEDLFTGQQVADALRAGAEANEEADRG